MNYGVQCCLFYFVCARVSTHMRATAYLRRSEDHGCRQSSPSTVRAQRQTVTPTEPRSPSYSRLFFKERLWSLGTHLLLTLWINLWESSADFYIHEWWRGGLGWDMDTTVCVTEVSGQFAGLLNCLSPSAIALWECVGVGVCILNSSWAWWQGLLPLRHLPGL